MIPSTDSAGHFCATLWGKSADGEDQFSAPRVDIFYEVSYVLEMRPLSLFPWQPCWICIPCYSLLGRRCGRRARFVSPATLFVADVRNRKEFFQTRKISYFATSAKKTVAGVTHLARLPQHLPPKLEQGMQISDPHHNWTS